MDKIMLSSGIPLPKESVVLRFLYQTVFGRLLLKAATARSVSAFCGRFMDSGVSRALIPLFIKKAGIDRNEYKKEDYLCFNDCFARHIRPELRPVDPVPEHLISPCDALLSVYPIRQDQIIPVKQSRYSVCDLLQDKALASRFENGLCLVFRLCVHHYHRYCYFDSGTKQENVFIPGRLHTVQPIALRERPVFAENCREYTVMNTDHFGTAVQIEVGAMLVGKICNRDGAGCILRGEEKGHFAYGGSTIILLLESHRAHLPESLLLSAENGFEVPVKMGQWIGTAYQNL